MKTGKYNIWYFPQHIVNNLLNGSHDKAPYLKAHPF